MQPVLKYPLSDAGLLGWANHIVEVITPTPSDWGLVTGDVTDFTALTSAFSDGLLACDPAVRNKAAVVAKNSARADLKIGASLLANKVYASAAVTDAMKTELGIPPRARPTPRPAPTQKPVIEVIDTDAWTVRIRIRASEGSRRGLPEFVAGASVFSHVGPTPATNISDWKFEGSCGRVTRIDIPFPSTLAAGTKVWLCSFFFNGRKVSGPACDPVSANLPGGGVSMAA